MRRRNPPPSHPPEFFTDRGLGKRVVEGLRGEGWIVRSMPEMYPSSDRSRSRRFNDENWIPAVTEQGLVILSKDGFRYAHERAAIVACGARVFMIPNASLRAEYMVERFVTAQATIFAHCRESGPFLFSVHPSSIQPVTLPDP
jgi:hypothetical protein